MNNKLTDLNNHLFAQMERLSDEDLNEEQLRHEIDRAKAITAISSQIIQNGALVLQAEKFKQDRLDYDSKLPLFLEG
jgi:hypothetical protein